ncbi:hypothetical protein BXZ70DRAFT_1007590 [Cristinia sonorae]|uniref:Uncharacterized protein n=1 Tax=Cristinia sonorae TaxID=1940300 RepID=A0A8K0URS1_9AGAR|nr:hypothetical protein BXZ70DRAFT_1007590 [Cristinia sonorae]
MSHEYDERLLASAPAATRAEKQGGYNIDLLESRNDPTSTRSSTPPAFSPNTEYAENGGYPKETARLAGSVAHYDAPGVTRTPTATTIKTPWYKTKKGIIALFILAIVVVAAAVGGGVGGTVGKHKNNTAESSSPAPSDTAAGDIGPTTGGGGTGTGGTGGGVGGVGPGESPSAGPNAPTASPLPSPTSPDQVPSPTSSTNPGSIGGNGPDALNADADNGSIGH